MLKKLFPALLLCLFVGCNQQHEVTTYAVVPHPTEIAYGNGNYRLGDNPNILFPEALADEAVLLGDWLGEDFGISHKLAFGKKKAAISLQLDETILPGQPEGYVLEVERSGITIRANAREGILHGMQTLRQIIRKEEDKLVVQTGLITDYPAYSWRAFMLDEGRYFKGKQVVLDLLDEMALLKMNRFHWHLTNDQGWRIEIKKYPKLTEVGAFRDSSEINHFHSNIYDGKPHGGFYTQEEIKEVVAYATERGITIVPEISMPGHASAAIAAYPWLGTTGKQIKVPCYFGVHYNAFNVADPKVMEFFGDVMDEVIALFPGDIVHIGGDEVKYDEWKASRTIQAYMKEHGLKTPAELQVFFTNRIANMLDQKGRRMMGWNEIMGQQLHEYQSTEDTKVEQTLNSKAIVHFWKGDQAQMLETVQKGYDMVNSFHVFTYIDYSYKSIPLRKAYSFDPTPEGITPEQKKHVLGLGCQMWGEFIPTVESMNQKVYPRIAAYAEVGWTAPDRKDYDRFRQSLQYFTDRWAAKGIVYGQTEE
ncbi:beta-N-acetylhexosaminidase [Parabacteroides sp. OttesenSCG-928-K15]|nr:beta-N-acetylhexosaminidase [Parabacteroides sp. OttesenSCG-928-K15]